MDLREPQPQVQFVRQKPYCWWWRCLCSCSTLTAWLRHQRWTPPFEPSGCYQRSRGSSPSSPSRTLHRLLRFLPWAHLFPGLHSGCQLSWMNPACDRGSMTCRPTAPRGSGWTRCCTGMAGPPTGTAQRVSCHLSQTHEPPSKEGGQLWEDREIMRKDQ